MTLEELIILARQAAARDSVPLPTPATWRRLPLAALLNDLLRNNRADERHHQEAITCLRAKAHQLLMVMDTIPLRPEELADDTLISTDPISAVAATVTQILAQLRRTNRNLETAAAGNQAIFEVAGGGK